MTCKLQESRRGLLFHMHHAEDDTSIWIDRSNRIDATFESSDAVACFALAATTGRSTLRPYMNQGGGSMKVGFGEAIAMPGTPTPALPRNRGRGSEKRSGR